MKLWLEERAYSSLERLFYEQNFSIADRDNQSFQCLGAGVKLEEIKGSAPTQIFRKVLQPTWSTFIMLDDETLHG